MNAASRAALAALVLPLGLALAACGDGGAPPLLVEIVPFAADGEAPTAGWRLRGADGAEVPLVPDGRAPGHGGRVFRAAAAAGRFAVVGPDPWSLVGGPVLVPMSPGGTPTALGVGRKHALYLVPPEGRPVGAVALRPAGRRGPDDVDRAVPPVPFERKDGPDGRVALHLPPARWKESVVVHAALGPDGFARPDPVTLPADGTCTGVALVPALTLPVRVQTVPPAPGRPLVLVADGPEFAVQRTLALDGDGAVAVDDFPQTGHTIRFALDGEPGAAPTWAMAGSDAVRGDVRLAVPPPGTARRPVPVAGVRGPVRVQGRPPGAPTYGLLPDVGPRDDGVADGVAARVPSGWSVLVDADGAAVVVGADDAGPAPFLGACRVRLAVEGGVPRGRRYELDFRRVEADGEVTAQGWYDRLVGRADLELSLPPGRYRFRLTELGRVAPWSELLLEGPSTRASVRLPAPR